MSDTINNDNDMVEVEDNNVENPMGNPSQRRRQQLRQGPQIRRIFRGQPPRGFRIVNRNVHPNNIAGIPRNPDNDGPNININGTNLQNNPLNGDANGHPNVHRNRNVRRLQFNMGGRGPFIFQQNQQRPNPSTQFPQQQQQQPQFHPMGLNGPVQTGPNGNVPVQVRMVQVQMEPLAPQPLSDSAATHSNAQVTTGSRQSSGKANERMEDPPDYESYKCSICYEYLNDPVGCGKCASRFCRACLQKVYESDQQKQQPTKCPVCRCEYNEMVPDLEIYGGANGDNVPTLPCRYVSNGCEERNLKLFEIAKHEQVCGHALMRCRYSPYGCRWVGKRCLIQAHEEFGCKLAPMGTLIEQCRQMKADHSMRLEMLAQQTAGSIRMSHVLRQTYTRDNQRKSLSDTLRLIQYCHAVTSLTPHFFMTKDLWVSYWRNNESRAAVINFCICIPLLSAAFGVIGHGTNSFFELFEEMSPGTSLAMLARALESANMNIADLSNHTSTQTLTKLINKLQESQTEELLITAFLGMCVGTLGMLVVMLNHIDTKSNITWDKILLPYLGYRFPLVGDVMAISIFTLLMAIMEYHESNMRATVLWAVIVATTTFFPALVFSISHHTARLVTRTPRPEAFNLMEMARLVEPCMFGLRFSVIILYFGVAATLDASIILSLMPHTSRIYLKNSFFDHIPRSICFAFLGAKTGFWIFQVQDLLFGGSIDLSPLKSPVTIEIAQNFFTSSAEAAALSRVFDKVFSSFLATMSLMLTSYSINNFFALGITMGDYIALTSQGELSPEVIARGTAKEYSPLGIFAFGSWVMMITLLARI